MEYYYIVNDEVFGTGVQQLGFWFNDTIVVIGGYDQRVIGNSKYLCFSIGPV